MIIHFSTSIYSKLIVTCSARPQCLNIASPVKSSLGMAPDATKCVLETVTRFLKKDFRHFGQNTPEIKKKSISRNFSLNIFNIINQTKKETRKIDLSSFHEFFGKFPCPNG